MQFLTHETISAAITSCLESVMVGRTVLTRLSKVTVSITSLWADDTVKFIHIPDKSQVTSYLKQMLRKKLVLNGFIMYFYSAYCTKDKVNANGN